MMSAPPSADRSVGSNVYEIKPTSAHAQIDARPARDILRTNVPDHEQRQEPVPEISRDEMNARLEAIEARMDARVASIDGKIDALIVRIDEREKAADSRFGRIESDLKEIRSETKNFKWWLIGLVVPTGIAVVFGIGAFNATLLSNMVASFESGKSTAAAQAEVKRQGEETAALLRQIQAQVNQLPATPTK